MELPPAFAQPQQPPQILSMEQETPSALPKRKFSLSKFLSVFIILVLFFGGGTIAAFAAYTSVDIPLLSKEQENLVALALYHVPLLPKTPEQILLAAVDSNTQLNTYTPEFSVSGTLGASSVTAASFDLNIVGPVDFTPQKPASFDLSLQGGVNIAGTSYQVAGKMRKVGNLMYFKLDSLSDSILELVTNYLSFEGNANPEQQQTADEIKNNLKKLFEKWISYDTGNIQSEARKALDARGADQSLIDSTRRKTNELLLEKTILPEIKKMNDETIDGVSSYHLQLIPSKDTMRKLLVESYPEDHRMTESATQNINNALDAISSLQMDVWFGKNDAILRKLSVQSSVKLDTYTQSLRNMNTVLGSRSDLPLSIENLANPIINTSMVLLIKDIGKPVTVEVPKSAVTSQEYVKQLQDAMRTEEQRAQESVKTRFDTDMRTIGSALLKYYVDQGSYPLSLTALVGKQLPSSHPAVKSLANYIYRRSADGKNFMVYIEYSSSFGLSSSTPYYGITSDLTFPHQLAQEDFDKVR